MPRPRPSLILLLGVYGILRRIIGELKKWHFKKDKWQVTKKKNNQDLTTLVAQVENIHVKKQGKKLILTAKKKMVKKNANIGFILDFGHFVTYSFALTAEKKVDSGGKLISTFVLHSGRSFHILIDD